MAYGDSVRKGQLIVPFGVGAMIDFPEDTFMTASLDFWPYETAGNTEQKNAISEATRINDSRLQKRVSSLLGKKIDFFLSPTEGKSRAGQQGIHLVGMPFVRFPTWLTCPRCNVLKKYGLNSRETPRCDSSARRTEGGGKLCSELKPNFRSIMQPVRFIIACESGHIDDFPWQTWAHRGKTCSVQNSSLFLSSTGAPGLSGTRVSCTCGSFKTMEGSFNKEFLGEIPINPEVGKQGDLGLPIVESKPDHEISKIYLDFAKKIKSTYL